jgi:N12 class adenine-specific DNA methylase
VPVAAFESLASSVLEWGTKRRHAGLILMDALSGAIPTIWDTFTDLNGTEHRQVNPTETQAAKDKLAAMHEAFSAWVWTDAERTDRLCDIYNREWNDTVSRQFNGDHLLLPGASSAVVMRPHQKRAKIPDALSQREDPGR